jgi:hypothetical protein
VALSCEEKTAELMRQMKYLILLLLKQKYCLLSSQALASAAKNASSVLKPVIHRAHEPTLFLRYNVKEERCIFLNHYSKD